MSGATTLTGEPFSRPDFESLLKRRFFFTEAFEIYRQAGFKGDNRGLYDYGPPGCALTTNIVDQWRRHFVIEESMLELDCTVLTPESVLQTSGHVDKFADWMCRDPVKGEYLRADHLVEGVLEDRLAKSRSTKQGAGKLDDAAVAEYEEILAQIDNFDGSELGDIIKHLAIRNPNGGGEVEPPIPFNLMFKSSIGPSAASPVYLRPETAQGQFLNFKKLLDFGQGSMPFASASVGKSYRNEISPRSGLLRVREFLMAEIEHFVDPDAGKRHERFGQVAAVELPFLDKESQLSGKTQVMHLSIGEAVSSKLVDNETLGYFLARVYLFLVKIGADKSKLRFRQHLANEMAHYACDCWDAELLTSYGWIECVGCADRSAYDLTVHAKKTGAPLVVKERLPEPRRVARWQATLDKKTVGPRFKKDAKSVQEAVAALGEDSLEVLAAKLAEKGVVTVPTEKLADGRTSVELSRDVLTIERVTAVETTREYTPNVIEPSFGIGRILYSVLEHTYWYRPQDPARGVLSLPLSVAPTKVLIVTLSSIKDFLPAARRISTRLAALGIANNIDSTTASIGKRYARNDELGTPLGITVDFDTLRDGSVTLRERDGMAQVRGSEEHVVQAVRNLVDGVEGWGDVMGRLLAFEGQSQG